MAPIVPMTSADILTISLYLDVRTYFQGPPRSVHMAHIKALRRSMVSSLMCRGICGREMWKMDSIVTDVGWGAGGGLYSCLSFLFICSRDPLSPKAHYFPSSHPYGSTFQSTHSSVSELILLPLLYIADF